MLYDENDINFDKISDADFEEVCFELLISLGYKGLIWRQGGADSGRDIEGMFHVNNPLVDNYVEKWFFECKRYKSGVSPNKLNSKIAWADAEKPKHLVFFVSSYLSNNARTWLDKIAENKPYNIHVVEGKRLKQMILGNQSIVAKYFVDEYIKLLLEARKNWLVHNVFPDPEMLSIVTSQIDANKLDASEIAFLWCACKIKGDEIDEWILENEPFFVNQFFQDVAQNSNCSEPLISQKANLSLVYASSGSNDWEISYPKYTVAKLNVDVTKKPKPALYCIVRDSEGEGVEVLITATSDFPAKIRYIEKNARDDEKNAFEILLTKRINA